MSGGYQNSAVKGKKGKMGKWEKMVD